MSSEVMKIEVEVEACCVCRGTGELLTPEEYDSGAPPMQTPLRTILLSLNNNKVIPDGRYCNNCIRRAIEAQEFSSALATRGPPPLSEKIRALRRRLHELTQKIDVFIVVGGPGADTGGAYSEDDIILVEKDTLAAAVTADDEDLERARNARGDTVYQCSVCPISFERVSEYRDHMNLHPADAVHCCWTCGAQFPNRSALRVHADQHSESHALHCYLCDTNFTSHFDMRRHEPQCTASCPACGDVYPDRASLSNHVAASHERGDPPLVCSACFLSFESSDLLSAHMLRHRQAKQYVCGYDGCILRFGNRNNLMTHIRKVHGGEVAEAPEEPPQPRQQSKPALVPCEHCERQFASVPAMKRHLRVHRQSRREPEPEIIKEEIVTDMQMLEGDEDLEGEVEYLEVETLEDMEDGQEYDQSEMME